MQRTFISYGGPPSSAFSTPAGAVLSCAVPRRFQAFVFTAQLIFTSFSLLSSGQEHNKETTSLTFSPYFSAERQTLFAWKGSGDSCWSFKRGGHVRSCCQLVSLSSYLFIWIVLLCSTVMINVIYFDGCHQQWY